MFKISQILEFSISTRQSINAFVLDFVLWSFVFVCGSRLENSTYFGFADDALKTVRISGFPVLLSNQNVVAKVGKKTGKLLRHGFTRAFC